MEVLFILAVSVIPFALGLALFFWLSRKESALPWQAYTTLRGIVFSLLIMPTFFVYGDGGMLTNTLAGAVTVIVVGGFDVGISSVAFGKSSGPAVYLAPFFLGFGFYIVIFIMDLIVHKK